MEARGFSPAKNARTREGLQPWTSDDAPWQKVTVSRMEPDVRDLKVKIVRFVDEYQPGWVECEFFDIEGRIHKVIEKIPVVTSADLWRDSAYPQPGIIRCELLEKLSDTQGKQLARITTDRPWAIQSTKGLTEFVVEVTQLTEPRKT